MLRTVKIRDGHDNFFTPIRFMLAYMVLLGHAFVVTRGSDSAEPHVFYQFTMSYMAVNFFFIASGFLVTGSMLYRKSLANFAAARILRIYPALIVHVFLMMFLFGILFTGLSISRYLGSPDLWKQPFLVLPFIQTDMYLPGIFLQNPEQIGSASLWTLRYEFLAYIGTFLAFSLGLMKHRWMVLAQFLAFAIALPVAYQTGLYDKLPATLRELLRFGVCYGAGAAIYAYRDRLKFHILVIPVLVGLTALLSNTVIFEVVGIITAAYILFWAAYVKLPKLDFLKKFNDISYGLYIYHWVVLQGIYYYLPGINVVALIALSTPLAIALALLSWHYVEEPALRLKSRFGEILSRKAKPQPA